MARLCRPLLWVPHAIIWNGPGWQGKGIARPGVATGPASSPQTWVVAVVLRSPEASDKVWWWGGAASSGTFFFQNEQRCPGSVRGHCLHQGLEAELCRFPLQREPFLPDTGGSLAVSGSTSSK